MKLSKIYSNKPEFKSCTFNDGFNVLLGKITDPNNLELDTHNLGKTTLVHIIDFLLLKGVTKSHIFSKHNEKFNGYVFYLEIKLNNNTFLTIKRSVAHHTKISIKLHLNGHQDFRFEGLWDFEDLPLTSDSSDRNPKKILDRLLGFEVLNGVLYRKTLSYFIRTQEDYGDVFKLDKYRGKDISWKPYLFELLGFERSNLTAKYERDAELSKTKAMIHEFKDKLSVDPDEIDKIKGTIDIKQYEKNECQKLVDSFNFYLEEKTINRELVDDVETKISELNSLEYKHGIELKRLKGSIQVGSRLNLTFVEQLFNEANLYFTDQLRNSYDQLIQFNKDITEERNRYLNDRIQSLESEIQNDQAELRELNQKRVEYLSFLNEKDSFKKFKIYQNKLSKIESDIARLESKLESIDIIDRLTKDQKLVETNIEFLSKSIQEQVSEGNETLSQIRILFNNFLKKIINQIGFPTIVPSSTANIEFKVTLTDEDGETTSQGDGFSYKKILCVCFDLALLITYGHKSYFRFVYHDGVLENLDNRKKIEFLNLIRSICVENNIQYILTLIEDDTPTHMENIQFSDEEIVLVLTDEAGDKGRLFSMSY